MDYSCLHIHLLELDLAVVLFLADNCVVDDHTRMVFGFMLLPVGLGDTPRLFYHTNDKVCVEI